jgi:DNA-binding MarR family transcriptional regulator
MVNGFVSSATTAAEMMAHLARLAHGEGFVCGLTAAQWTALRYFAHANRFSRTVSAFANYHATTRGTASQTVKSLVSQGYLTRTRSESDGRSARFDLTQAGRVLYGNDPFEDLVRAIAELPQGLQGKLLVALERVMGHMASERQKRPFGTCPFCGHLDECVYRKDEVIEYFCRLENEPIEPSELEEICINFEPRAGSVMKRSFTREPT